MFRNLRSVTPRLRASSRWVQSRRSYASLSPGDQLHGFTLKRTKEVPELELTALHLQHDKTGADYLHVAREDSNNVFSIGFKTNPPDDTGVPHILEHTTLCGSEKYPIRDPFFKMLPRSLSNFMNAFTSSDHTSYPFATTNAQDFRNLMSVYMDATLHPLLNPNDFAQEGWRIGPENPQIPTVVNSALGTSDDRLVFKGVVYNEMKGQMSDASYLFYVRFQDHLFPDIHNSGGDPQKITDLTYEQLKQFHANHYHPSNAKILTYGNFPLEEHLANIGPRLDAFEKIEIDAGIREPVSLEGGPKEVTVKGPIDPLTAPDKQHKTSVSWLLCETSDIVETFSLGVVSSLLLDGYGSPLYRALVESGLGTDYSPNTGFDGSGKVGVFSVGLNGVRRESVPDVRKAVFEALTEVKDKGFDSIKVDGILHQLELSLKHKTAQFGLGLIQRLNPGWFNGVDPFDALAWQDTVTAFKNRYAQEGYLEGLVERYLLNDRTLTFTMEPSEAYSQELAGEETRRLASKIQEVTKDFASEGDARRHLEQRELELLHVQEQARNQDVSCLPTVHVRDIPRIRERKPVRFSSVDNVKVQWREAPTNGITYFRAVNAFESLPDELREMIPLFSDAIMRLGTKDLSVEQLEELLKLKTGGISIGYHSVTSPFDTGKYEEGLIFSGSALDRNVPAMFELLNTVLRQTDFENPEAESKIRELLQASASGAVNSVAEAGHAYARRFAEAGLNPAARLRELASGLSQVKLTTSLASRPVSESLADVIQKLKSIQSFVIGNGSGLRVALTCDAESSASNERHLQAFLSSLPKRIQPPAGGKPLGPTRNAKSFFPLPYQVYYSALALPTVPYVHPAGAPLQILSQLLTHRHLHHEIREKGGAYGGGAYANGLNGVFGFYSYRDPNPQNTMKIISESGAWARDREWTPRDLEEAKLSVFQSLDAPESVSQEGMTLFLSGVDEGMMQKRREQLLDVKTEDVREVAEEYLVKGMERGNLAILGEKRDWVQERHGWRIEDIGMRQMVQELMGETEAMA